MDQAKSPRRLRPTMQAIAKLAGVSRSTVSHVLANHVEFIERFKPDTVDRVRKIASELGYTANLMALSLRSSHPSFFALVLRGANNSEFTVSSWHHLAFEAQFQAGVLEASRTEGLYPVLAMQDAREPASARDRIRTMLDGGVLGAIARSPDPELSRMLHQHIEKVGLPVVVVFPAENAFLPTNCIDLDNEAAGRLAARTLLAAGRRTLVVVQPEHGWTATRLRTEAFVATAREAGAEVSIETIPDGLGLSECEARLSQRFGERRPTGVYATCGSPGPGIVAACQAAGLRVPEDVALLGSDTALWRAAGDLEISSVDVSWYEAGRAAVKALVGLAREDGATFANISLPPRLVVGKTCPIIDK